MDIEFENGVECRTAAIADVGRQLERHLKLDNPSAFSGTPSLHSGDYMI